MARNRVKIKDDKITLRSDVYATAILDVKGNRMKKLKPGGLWALTCFYTGENLEGGLSPAGSRIRCAQYSLILSRSSLLAQM